MKTKREIPVLILMTACCLGVAATTRAEQNVLFNGSMESGPGAFSEDPRIPADWVRFGAVVERSGEANLVPDGPGHALKAFASEPQEGAFQEFAISPGDSVIISASLYTRTQDRISGDARAGIVLEFYNTTGNLVGPSNVNFAMDASSPADTWIEAVVGPTTAPAGAVTVRMTCVWLWNGSAQGSAYWDDCSLTVNDGPNELLNADFEQAGLGDISPFGIDEWTGFNDQRKSDDFAYHGQFSARLGMLNSFSGLFQDIGVLDAGERILIKARVFNASSDPLTADARAGLKLEFSDPTGSGLPPPVENLPIGQEGEQDVWTPVEVATEGLIEPEGANLAEIVMIFVGDTESGGAVYFESAIAEVSGQPGVNQLQNPSFEMGPGGFNGLTHWQEFGSGGATAQKSVFEVPTDDGIAVLKATGPAVTGVSQLIDVVPGDTLSASALLRLRSTNPLVGPAVAGIKVEWSGGSIPDDVDITAGPSDNTITAASPTDEWIELFIDFEIPPGAQARVQFTNLVARGSAESGVAYFDACEAVVLNRFDGADWDGDDDQDLIDFGGFQACFHGSGATPLEWNCTVFDVNDDQTIDLDDFSVLWPAP